MKYFCKIQKKNSNLQTGLGSVMKDNDDDDDDAGPRLQAPSSKHPISQPQSSSLKPGLEVEKRFMPVRPWQGACRGSEKMKMPLATCNERAELARRPLYLSRLITKICVKS